MASAYQSHRILKVVFMALQVLCGRSLFWSGLNPQLHAPRSCLNLIGAALVPPWSWPMKQRITSTFLGNIRHIYSVTWWLGQVFQSIAPGSALPPTHSATFIIISEWAASLDLVAIRWGQTYELHACYLTWGWELKYVYMTDLSRCQLISVDYFLYITDLIIINSHTNFNRVFIMVTVQWICSKPSEKRNPGLAAFTETVSIQSADLLSREIVQIR